MQEQTIQPQTPRVGVGAVILNDQQEVLLLLRSAQARNDRGLWSVPGGALEHKEKAHDAIVRECKEEVGIDIAVDSFVGYVDYNEVHAEEHWVGLIFLVKRWKGVPQNAEPHKADDMRWFSLSELPANMTYVATEALRLAQLFHVEQL